MMLISDGDSGEERIVKVEEINARMKAIMLATVEEYKQIRRADFATIEQYMEEKEN